MLGFRFCGGGGGSFGLLTWVYNAFFCRLSLSGSFCDATDNKPYKNVLFVIAQTEVH